MVSGNPWAALLIGQSAGEYELTGVLGAGGFGIVLEGQHRRTGELAAVKILPPPTTADPTFEFANEGKLLSGLRGSTNVVHLFETGHVDVQMTGPTGTSVPVRMPYHALELAQGCLEQLVQDRNRLKWSERLLLWRGCIRGVHQMHLRSVAHRDLKSENCLLFERPKNLVESKVADLGRSRDLKAGASRGADEYLAGRGDLRFAPPEFLAFQGNDTRETHIAADLYGLGSLLFELATGQCITSIALGFGPHVVRANLTLLHQGQSIDLSGMRADYEPSFQMFERAVPNAIRQPAGSLLRQLCDPVPSARTPRPKFAKQHVGVGLEWLLTRADILTKSLLAEDRKSNGIAMKRGA